MVEFHYSDTNLFITWDRNQRKQGNLQREMCASPIVTPMVSFISGLGKTYSQSSDSSQGVTMTKDAENNLKSNK